MLFIMEGIDLALLIQIFKGFKSTLPRPAGFANFRGTGRGGVRPAFWGAVRGSPFFRGTGRGAHPWKRRLWLSWRFKSGFGRIPQYAPGQLLSLRFNCPLHTIAHQVFAHLSFPYGWLVSSILTFCQLDCLQEGEAKAGCWLWTTVETAGGAGDQN